MMFHSSGRFLFRIAFAAALSVPGVRAFGEIAQPENSELSSDPMKRLEWLKSRPPAPAARKTYFRNSENRAATIRNPESQPRATHPAEAAPATPRPLATPAPAEVKPPATRTPEPKTASARTTPTPAAKSRSADEPASTPRPMITTGAKSIASTKSPTATPAESKTAAASTPTPKTATARATPAPPARLSAAATPAPTPPPPPIAAGPKAIKPLPMATPMLEARLTTPRPIEFKTTDRTTPVSRGAADSSYPWKTSIVTTVFWVGEPVGGNNFTHNRSSSWDANWARNFGGFDNPDPDARRRFIAAKFVPRQNPFYIALPYNDVTRGTTKPEARAVIPWFKTAFVREGQSICRDRWVAVRNRAGRIGYAQWSDCGPFRTDHWQYVFGKDRPKPNLNKGAGLDVSPGLRDYLGLDGTDLTDWKFVDFKDVPDGPWSLYGGNNPFTQKATKAPRKDAKAGSANSSDALARNL